MNVCNIPFAINLRRNGYKQPRMSYTSSDNNHLPGQCTHLEQLLPALIFVLPSTLPDSPDRCLPRPVLTPTSPTPLNHHTHSPSPQQQEVKLKGGKENSEES